MVLAGMNVFSNVVNSWWGITFWAATDAPKFRDGWISMFPLSVFTTLVALAIVYMERRERRKKLEWGSSSEEVPQEQVGYTLPEKGSAEQPDDRESEKEKVGSSL